MVTVYRFDFDFKWKIKYTLTDHLFKNSELCFICDLFVGLGNIYCTVTTKEKAKLCHGKFANSY